MTQTRAHVFLSRAALVLLLASGLVAAPFPPASAGIPETVTRTAHVRGGQLLAERGPSPLSLRADGTVRAHRTGRSAGVRSCAPIWFTAVGITWDQGSRGEVETLLRTSADGRRFGPAGHTDMESAADRGTLEHRRGRQGTELVWVGGARCIRFSMQIPRGTSVRGVEVIFINTSGTADGPGRERSESDGAFAATAASAAVKEPRFIDRDEWGAKESLRNCGPFYADELKMGFVHHTAGTNKYPKSKSDDIVRSIYAYHTNGRGWCDIAYNFLIDRYGRIFIGRAGGPDQPVIPAATQGFNTGSFAVSLMGSFDHKRPTKTMIRSLQDLLAWRLDVAGLPAKGKTTMVSGGGSNTRYKKGEKVKLNILSVHRNTGYTACPGNKVVRRMSGIRDKVAKMLKGPSIYDAALSSSTLEPDTEDIRITARSREDLEWTVEVADEDGDVVTTLTDQGDRLDLVWEGSNTTPYPRDPGTYDVEISGENVDGERAGPEVLQLTVKPAVKRPGR